MAKVRRWSVSFKSLKGVDCIIYISCDSSEWNGSVITSLTAPSSPFVIEEDNDDNLLNGFRFKTGNLRLIETEEQRLSDIYPETDTSRYIEFYYDGTLEFAGYMQSVSFENDYVAFPRELTFPIISPLGLSDGMNFIASRYDPPRMVSFGEVLSDAIGMLGGSYQSVVLPSDDNFLSFVFQSHVICPFNSDFSHSSGTVDDVFAPVTLRYFLEGITSSFALILHDTPNELVFTRFDYSGNYVRYSIDDLVTRRNPTTLAIRGDSEFNFNSYFDLCSADGKESIIRPYSCVNVNFEGSYIEKSSLSFLRTHFTTYYEREYTEYIDDKFHKGHIYIANLSPVYIDMTRPNGFSTVTPLDINGNLSSGIYCCSTGDKDKQNECILVVGQWRLGNEWSEIFTAKLFVMPPQGYRHRTLTVSMMYGEKLDTLKPGIYSTGGQNFVLKVSIEIGGKYYTGDEQRTWVNNETMIDAPFYYVSGKFSLPIYYIPTNGTATVKIYGRATDFPQDGLVAFTSVELEDDAVMYSDYYDDKGKEYQIKGESPSDETVDVSRFFYNYPRLSNQFFDANNQEIPLTTLHFPSLDYMLSSRDRIRATFYKTGTFSPSYYYFPKFVFFNGWKYRIIAFTFNPWDDEYTISLQHSELLE